jgi:uncharacterized repeat protein (TIGR01451 family)
LPDQFEIVNDDYGADDGTSFPGSPIITTTVYAPSWAITKTVSSDTTAPNEYLTYTITITNIGQMDTNGAYTIIDSIPDHTDFVKMSSPGKVSTSPPTWQFTDVLAASTGAKSVSYTVKVRSPLTSGTKIVNHNYSVSGGNTYGTAISNSITTTVASSGTLIITKTDGPDPVTIGERLVYTLTVTNDPNADGPAENVTITDTLPAEVTFHSAGFIGPASGITSTNGSDVIWIVTNPASLAVGASVEVTVAVTVKGQTLPTPPLITNTYQTSAGNAPLVSGPAVKTTLVAGDPDDMSITPASSLLKICETTIVTTTIVDNWGNPVSGEQANLNILPGSPPPGNATILSTNPHTTNGNGFFTATLKAIDTGYVRILGETVKNYTPAVNYVLPSPGISISVQSIPTQLTVAASPDPLPAGGNTGVVTATIRDCNNDPVSGQPVTITLNNMGLAWFPGPSDYATGTTNTAGEVVATLTSTATQTAGTLTLTGDSGSLQGVAKLDIASTVLTITKTADPASGGTIYPAETISYTIRLTNTGAATATDVLLTDTLPLPVNYVGLLSSTTGNGSISGPAFPGGNVIVLSISRLEPAQTMIATIGVTVTATMSGTTLNNTANAKSGVTVLITSNIVAHTVITKTTSPNDGVYLPIILKNQGS